MPADFKILRGSVVIPNGQTSLTLVDGVDYSLEAGIADDAWFFSLASNHFGGMGRTSGGGSQNADDHTCWIAQVGKDITITRSGSTNNCRVDWQILQYIGAPDGPNAIKIREKGTLTGTGSAALATLPATVADASNLVPWIVAQGQNGTGRNNTNRSLFTSEVNGGDAVFNRFTNVSTYWLSYALLEFTGTNWQVSNEQFATPGSGAQSVALASPVADVEQTFLHCTYRYETSGTVGLDDASVRVRLTSASALETTTTTATDAGLKRHSVWLIQNPNMVVSRYVGTMAGSGEEEAYNVPITPVADVNQTLTTLTNDSTGSGTAFPRGFINHLLSANDNTLLRQSDNGQTSRYAIEVVELPQSPAAPDPTLIPAGATHTQSAASGQALASALASPTGAMHSQQSTLAVLLSAASLGSSTATHLHLSVRADLLSSAGLIASFVETPQTSTVAPVTARSQLGPNPAIHTLDSSSGEFATRAAITPSATVAGQAASVANLSIPADLFPKVSFRVMFEDRKRRVSARGALAVQKEERALSAARESRAFSVDDEWRRFSIKKAIS
ncbi:MAG: hypothetical protein AAFZ11_08150 [Pseudomonadota bacterium]